MARSQQKNLFLVCRRGCQQLATAESFLAEVGVRPIRLYAHERPPEALIQRFENYASDAYAIVLLTEDPAHKKSPDPSLVFRLGFLAGRLGRRRVSALFRDGLNLPPECAEVLCIPFDEIGIWKFALMRDLMVAGFDVGHKLAVYEPKAADIPAPQRLVERG